MSQSTDVVDVYHGFVNQPWSPTVWRKQLQRLPQSLQNKVLRFRRWQDQHMALLGKLLLLEAMMAQGQGEDCLERLEVDEMDRPFIAGAADFNISHSGGAVVCAVSHHAKVGIDVELLRWLKPDNFTLCMTLQQIESFHLAADPAKALLEMWVAKESVAKAYGVGLGTDFRKMICSAESITLNKNLYHLHHLSLASTYLCCVATPMAQCQIQLHPCCTVDDLIVKSVD
jgi:4'-phosphopantetheinyl transferase